MHLCEGVLSIFLKLHVSDDVMQYCRLSLTKLASEDSDDRSFACVLRKKVRKIRIERLALTVLGFYCKWRHTNLTITLHYVKECLL